MVNEQRHMVTNWKYLNYASCGQAYEIVACFCNFCVTEKKQKPNQCNPYEDNFQDVYTLTVIYMMSQVKCSLPLVLTKSTLAS